MEGEGEREGKKEWYGKKGEEESLRLRRKAESKLHLLDRRNDFMNYAKKCGKVIGSFHIGGYRMQNHIPSCLETQ